MTEYLVKCKKCKIILTKKLSEFTMEEFLEFDKINYERIDYIPEGLIYQAHTSLNIFCVINKGNFIINLKDIKNYSYNNEGNRLEQDTLYWRIY